jgi:hypothetical protein
MAIRDDIEKGLTNRLKTITTANGYGTNVAKVYADDIPMGLDLDAHEMPAIFVLPSDEKHAMEHQQLVAEWNFELQLLQGDVSDSKMHQFVRDVYKCIWANSAVGGVNNAFKWQPNITHVLPVGIETDLNMIEANRLWIVTIAVHYRSKLNEI